MQLIKSNLISKNNKKTGVYLYKPIVKLNGLYFWCESIKTSKPTNQFSDLKIQRQIPIEYYKANDLPI
jgi:hypothetical protein